MIKITTKGPIFDRSGVRSIVQSEFASANRTASRTLTTAASGYVHRAFGEYEKGWRDRPTKFGTRTIVRDETVNPLVHAAVHETTRRAGTRAGGVSRIKAWIELRGIIPTRGNTDKNRLGFAIAISKKHAREGWPNLGSFKGGYYPGQAPAPVDRAMETQAATVLHAYDHAVSRIARRLG